MGAEVGVLELQIHDNSAKAASGLGNLASALTRVQKALGSGLRLGNTANQIGKIVEKMQSAIPEESVSRIERLANAMEKLSAAGRISIPSLKGLKVDSVKEAAKAAKENDPFETEASTAKTIDNTLEQTIEKIVEQKQATREAQEAMNGVAEYTEKAKEETGNLTDAMEPAKQAIKETKEEAEQLKVELQSVSSAAQSVKANSGFWKQYNPATGQFEEMEGIRNASDWSKAYDEKVARAAEEHARLSKIAEGIGRLREELDKPINWGNLSGGIDRMLGIGSEVKSAAESASVFMSNMEQVDAVEQTMDSAGTKAESLKDKLKALASEGLQRVKSELDGMKSGLQSILSPLTGFANQLWRVAKYRMLRAIVKQISEGFKEGVENYYHYSEAVNNGFSAAMDRAATSLQTFKNSIGAAVAPLIQALIPILQQVVTWVVTAINYVNQFIALLSGKTTWSKAIDTTAKAFENTKKKAGGASKAIKKTDNAVKDLLADFDELNIIQSQTGDNGGSGSGGGGGGVGKTATDFKKMFTEVSKFDNGIKQLVDNLKKNFGSILNLATEIGAAVLAWKVSSAFSGVIAQAAGLIGSAVIMDIVFRLSKSFTSTFLDTGDEGWLLMSGLTPLVGGFIARKLLNQIGLKGVGKYAIPIALAISATADISALVGDADVSALSAESIEAAVMSALKMGGAVGIALNAAGVLTAAGAAGAGVAAALLTFGVAIGLKATKEAMDVGEITTETIKADIVSALSAGGALAIGAAIVGGTAGTIVAAGALGAVLTFGVLIGIQALLQPDEAEPVKWGSTKFTHEQIDEFVGKMFTVKPSVVIEMLEEKINLKEGSREELQNAVTKTLGTLQLVKLGLDTDESLKQLEADVFTGEGSLMSRFKNYAKDQVTQIQTTLSFLTTEGENGKTKGESTAEKVTEGWSSLTEQMSDLGEQLSGAFQTAYSTKLGTVAHEEAVNTIATLTQMMTDISNAITYGTKTAKYLTGFESMAEGITRETAGNIIKSYTETKDQILAAQKESLSQTAEGTLALSLAFTQLSKGKNITQEQKAEYEQQASEFMALYRQQIKDLDKDAAAATEEILGDSETKKAFQKYLTDILDQDYLTEDANSYGIFNGIISDLLAEDGTFSNEELQERFKGRLQSFLNKSIPDDAQIYIDALNAGLKGYGDIFNEAFLQAITDSLDLGGESEEVRKQYIDIIRGIFGDGVADKIKLPTAEVEQEVEVETEVVEATADDGGGFDWSNYDFGAGNFEFELTDFHGAGTMEEWEDLWDAMFANGTGTEAAANALRGRLDEIVEMAFLGTGQGSKILEALKNGDLNYGDVIQQSVLQSIEEALGLEYDSPEIQEKWNAILDEIFGGEYSPEVDIDPEITGKTSGFRPFNQNQLIASAGMSGFGGGHGYGGQTPEETAAGVQAGTAAIQTDLQTGMATRQSDIQSGVQTGTSGLLAAINNLLSVAQAINNKQFTVNIVPSTTLGVVTRRSGQGLSRVTGNMEAPT